MCALTTAKSRQAKARAQLEELIATTGGQGPLWTAIESLLDVFAPWDWQDWEDLARRWRCWRGEGG